MIRPEAVLHDHEVIWVGRAELLDLALEGALPPSRCRPTAGRERPGRHLAGALPRGPDVPGGSRRPRGRTVRRPGRRAARRRPPRRSPGRWRADPGEGGQQHLEAFGAGRVGARAGNRCAGRGPPAPGGPRPRPARRSGPSRTGSRRPGTTSTPPGRRRLTGGPDASQNPESFSGSEASTQVSLLMAPAWLEMLGLRPARKCPSAETSADRPPGSSRRASPRRSPGGRRRRRAARSGLASSPVEVSVGAEASCEGLLADPARWVGFDPAPQVVPPLARELPGEHRRWAAVPRQSA